MNRDWQKIITALLLWGAATQVRADDDTVVLDSEELNAFHAIQKTEASPTYRSQESLITGRSGPKIKVPGKDVSPVFEGAQVAKQREIPIGILGWRGTDKETVLYRKNQLTGQVEKAVVYEANGILKRNQYTTVETKDFIDVFKDKKKVETFFKLFDAK